ncbi:MAG: class I SAM-dependent methyltransferase [Mariprofundaceae bacterium]|nr:class I SAM-dependent methyltransferase [Mariprofundaceae bacterium]
MSGKCRFCGQELSVTFCDLGESPISNANLEKEQLQNMEPYYPLHAQVCSSCYLVQLQEYESPEDIFNDEYAYFSSYSESWLEHSRKYTESMIKRFGFDASSQVVEIASNDGYLLQYFLAAGIPVLGIEPSANVAQVAEKKGIPTWVKFFGVLTARELVAEKKQADLLLGNNVLAHVPDLNDFVAGLKIALKAHGVITMEFPHLLRQVENVQFDQIYHEHFSYLSLITVEKVFAHHGLTIFDVEELSTHGGSIRIFARHTEDNSKIIENSVNEVREMEINAGLKEMATYEAFSARVVETKLKLLQFLINARQSGKRVAGYGAPAKGNTLLNYCGIGSEFIEFTVDLNPFKQGKYLPGTHIPIFSPEKIMEEKPDYILILPWNLRSEIMDQMAAVRDWGGKFVVPIPEVKVFK